MKTKNPLIQGTIILTFAGILSRVLGFYNRIFLSQFIGAKEVGIYQLIFPVYLLCFSICCQGIETSISRFVASCPSHQKTLRHRILLTGIALSFSLSIIAYAILFFFSETISISILKEPSCALCLKIISFAIPFVSIKACVLGYELGLTHSVLPACTQLVEQITRVGSIYALSITLFSNRPATASIATLGMALGELISFFFLMFFFIKREKKEGKIHTFSPSISYITIFKQLLHDSIPLTSNRLILTLLQSAEAILIPSTFFAYYHNKDLSLEFYGILTGMVMPFIYFPSAITNSLSVMLLPTISSAKSKNQNTLISSTASRSIYYSVLLGIFSCFLFLFYGKELGLLFFHNKNAGELLFMMALICPFTYLTTTLSSILNGLGKMSTTFVHNMISSAIMLSFVIFTIPHYGMKGFLWGLIASDLLLILLHLLSILRITHLSFHPYKSIIKPIFMSCICGGISFFIVPAIHNFYDLFLKCSIYGFGILLCLYVFSRNDFSFDEYKRNA